MTLPLHVSPTLYRSKRHPYYLLAPDYRRTSAGIRVMHQLCDALRQMGHDAWILTNLTHPGLNTPRLTDEVARYHQTQGLNPIAIYPEIVGANPLNAGVVVRYILNVPGLLGERPRYEASDLFYAHTPELLPSIGFPAQVLNMPPINSSVFHNQDNLNDARRQGHCIYFGRFTKGRERYAHLLPDSVEITSTFPDSHEALADLFRRTKRLYCFENTAISMEARLCGCPAVILPSPFFSRAQFFGGDLGFAQGVAFSEDPAEISQAEQTVGLLPELYPSMERNFWVQLAAMIETTQKEASVRPRPTRQPDSEANAAAAVSDASYMQWRKHSAFTESDAQVMAERMMLQWRERPGIHLLMAAQPSELEQVMTTLDSLNQQIYGDWILTVVSTAEQPAALSTHTRLQWLTLREASATHYVIDEMASHSPGQWLAQMKVGQTLAPEALLYLADAVQAHPEWRALYCDEDTIGHDRHFHSPHCKPAFNLDLLRSQDYIGNFLLVEKSALLAAGRFGALGEACHYDLVLRLFDQQSAKAIGHLAQVLLHSPATPNASEQTLAEKRQALEAHLERVGCKATVCAGMLTGTQQVVYPCSFHPVSLIVLSQRGPQWLRPLLDSLSLCENYPVQELVIVEGPDAAPGTTEYLNDVMASAPWAGRSQRLTVSGHDWAAQALNTGAEAAQGEFLLFLEDNTHFVQADFLERLVGLAQRHDVAVASPRVIDPVDTRLSQGPWLLGYQGLASSAWSQTELSAPGYMGRALCEQNTSAVSPAAWMISKARFLSVGRADPSAGSLPSVVLDLCLRASQAGFRHVWTPYAMLLQHSPQPQHELGQPKLHDQEVDTMLQRWLPQLASDPFYNPQLSLRQAFALEGMHPTPWRGAHAGKPRILAALAGHAKDSVLPLILSALNESGQAQAGVFDQCSSVMPTLPTLLDIARADPDWVILDMPTDPIQQALVKALKKGLPKTRVALYLGNSSTLRTTNFLCVMDPSMQRLLLHPLLDQVDCLLVQDPAATNGWMDLSKRTEVLPPLPPGTLPDPDQIKAHATALAAVLREGLRQTA